MAARAEVGGERGVARQLRERLDEFAGGLGIKVEGGCSGDFGQGAAIAAYDGTAVGHGFEQRHAETLVEGGEDEGRRMGIVAGEGGVVAGAVKDALRVQAERAETGHIRRGERRVAESDEIEVSPKMCGGGERLEHAIEIFVALPQADEEEVGFGQRAGRDGPGDRGGSAVRDDAGPGDRIGEEPHQVTPGGFGDADEVIGTSDGGCLRAAGSVRFSAFEREDEVDQIVNGQNGGHVRVVGGAGPKIGFVDHVGSPAMNDPLREAGVDGVAQGAGARPGGEVATAGPVGRVFVQQEAPMPAGREAQLGLGQGGELLAQLDDVTGDATARLNGECLMIEKDAHDLRGRFDGKVGVHPTGAGAAQPAPDQGRRAEEIAC